MRAAAGQAHASRARPASTKVHFDAITTSLPPHLLDGYCPCYNEKICRYIQQAALAVK